MPASALSYYKDGDWLKVVREPLSGEAGFGKVLQVVSATKTDAFSTTSTSFTTITGLTATITPTVATSKVFAMLSLNSDSSNRAGKAYRVLRGATEIGIGDAEGTRIQAGIFWVPAGADYSTTQVWTFLDSPGVATATTYTAECRNQSGSIFVNRGNFNNNDPWAVRGISTLTLMEIAA